jgi:hypothetical protein
LAVIVNDPDASVTLALVNVASVPSTVIITIDEVVTSELVTTNEVAVAAKFTLPEGLLIVCAPVVPVVVLVASKVALPEALSILNSAPVKSPLTALISLPKPV